MTDERVPILDFDPNRSAIIEPTAVHPRIDGLPHRCVMTWMGDAFHHFAATHDVVERYTFSMETSATPVYEFVVDGEPILVTMATVGAPGSAALLEALIALGCTDFMAVGSSGGLTPELPPGTIVIPDAAIRDEGVSYHYLAPGHRAHPDAQMQQVLHDAFVAAGNQVVRGITWTTDAFYRETEGKVAKRVSQGAIAVDMEAASLAAIAEFRGVRLGHGLYLADTLHSNQWDPTELVARNTAFRYELLLTTAHACASL